MFKKKHLFARLFIVKDDKLPDFPGAVNKAS